MHYATMVLVLQYPSPVEKKMKTQVIRLLMIPAILTIYWIPQSNQFTIVQAAETSRSNSYSANKPIQAAHGYMVEQSLKASMNFLEGLERLAKSDYPLTQEVVKSPIWMFSQNS